MRFRKRAATTSSSLEEPNYQDSDNLTRREDIFFGVNITSNTSRYINMTLSLTNGSPNDYYISSAVLLSDGLTNGAPFEISGPSIIECLPFFKYTKPNLFLLKTGVEVVNSIVLSDFCNFFGASSGMYNLSFYTYFDLYNSSNYQLYQNNTGSDEYSYLIGESSFVLYDETESITMSQTYGSTTHSITEV